MSVNGAPMSLSPIIKSDLNYYKIKCNMSSIAIKVGDTPP